MPSDPLTQALIARMIQTGAFDIEDIEAMAQMLERMGEPDAARICRAAWARAIEPSQSDWSADKARERFRLLDGGNEDA